MVTFFAGRLVNTPCVKCSKRTPGSHSKHTSIPRKEQGLCLSSRPGIQVKDKEQETQTTTLDSNSVTGHRHFCSSPECRESQATRKKASSTVFGYQSICVCSLSICEVDGIFLRTPSLSTPWSCPPRFDNTDLHLQNQNVQDQDVARRHSETAANIWVAL